MEIRRMERKISMLNKTHIQSSVSNTILVIGSYVVAGSTKIVTFSRLSEVNDLA